MAYTSMRRLLPLAATSALILAGCSGGGSEPPTPPPPPPPPPPSGPVSAAFSTEVQTSRFLSQATFGASYADIQALTGTSPSEWLVNEFAKPAGYATPIVESYRAQTVTDDHSLIDTLSPTFAFWINAIEGDDQLRQRMVFALSQILVISATGDLLGDFEDGQTYYNDVLARNAFGNYRDLLEEVTYSPAMGFFLTYMGNRPADPATGRMPDENYARELLQLFTIGLVELNPDGTPVGGGAGREIYDNRDITGLAKVFTGLNRDTARENLDDVESDPSALARPMRIYPAQHSSAEKRFLGLSIGPGTDAASSIDQALDHIMAHPNVGPFVSRQLIQRFTTSNPDPDYVQRVAAAFDAGRYTLPNGVGVGDGRKGDLQATLAAILFDDDVRGDSALTRDDFGKIREPVLRFTQWARAFEADASYPEYAEAAWDMSDRRSLSQHPYKAASVFNFYRPGYIAPRTESGARGMTVPELQIVSATTTPGYVNIMSYWVTRDDARGEAEDLAALYQEAGFTPDYNRAATSFLPTYATELTLADNPEQLVDRLNLVLAAGQLSSAERQDIVTAISGIALTVGDEDARRSRVNLAILMVMASPDYLVQR